VDGSVRSDYFAEVFARVQGALDYPRRARLDRIEGVVLLQLRIDREGRLADCTVVESSGSVVLDRHAVRIAKRAAPFGSVPAWFSAGDLSFELPVEFALTR
jgi:protein TonB